MNRKSIMLEFLFWTILALIIFVPTIIFASKFFRLSDEALRSYNGLVNTINSMSNIAEMESYTLRMDDKTALIGYSREGTLGFRSSAFTFFVKSNKPAQCSADKACICLCRENPHVIKDTGELKCDKIICKDITKEIVMKSPFVSYSKPDVSEYDEKLFMDYFYENGFILTRGDIGIGRDTIYPQDILSDKKLRPVYIEKYKNYINVCERTPCISQEAKNIIDAEQIKNIGEVIEEPTIKPELTQ